MYFKKITLGFGLLLATLAGAQSGYGQTYHLPRTPDEVPHPGNRSARVENTGTDAMLYQQRFFQIMTWDEQGGAGQEVVVSWTPDQNPGMANSFRISHRRDESLSDPDVVIAEDRSGVLYAAVVYIMRNVTTGISQAYFDSYKYDTSGNSFSQVSHTPMGSNAGGRQHSFPNVDANSRGQLALGWQETITENVSVTVVSPVVFPSPGTTFQQTVTFAQVYGVSGYITGSVLCNNTRGGLISEPNQLLEQGLNPDVAISEEGVGGQAIVSFTYLRHFVDGTGSYSIGNGLNVKQYNWDACRFEKRNILDQYEWTAEGVNGVPRIAASPNPNTLYDVEVAVDWVSGCPPLEYAIYNYGKTGGSFRTGPALVAGGPGSQDPAVRPVVAFYGSYPNTREAYIVTWTASRYPNGNAEDVWGRSLVQGTLFGTDYSRVNDKDSGYQGIASVAGRHLDKDFGAAHLLYNAEEELLIYKLTFDVAGQAALRAASAPVIKSQPRASQERVGLMQSFPNPFRESLTLQLQLREGEKVESLIVTDVMGRVVGRIEPGPAKPGQPLKWTPKAALPAGSYIVKLVTNQRTETHTLNKE
ncbi:T9SS type A sorting domain-containing protein [Hymenobacter sp. BT175]|uniref:T9SS type A sorting domain-containing protein n=1 Tax=Hymenobacter translucens TaxID=2886507 RepID=UPI001D0DEB19|nr:T9SS type A sorting domain-containing protein [Hymenobacter translucens]MCC2548895.1 T9SS type A sorting domain-containing protein [Hymenobacter translucens]